MARKSRKRNKIESKQTKKQDKEEGKTLKTKKKTVQLEEEICECVCVTENRREKGMIQHIFLILGKL